MMLSQTTALSALVLAGALALTGCSTGTAPEVGPEKVAHSVSPTTSPERTFAPGDVVDAAQAEAINDDQSDTTVAYPVDDNFVVVTWGKPIPPAVREAVNTNVRAAAPEWGTSTDHRVREAQWVPLREAMQAESTKLGGITLMAVSCSQSFSEEINAYRPTWVISEPGPVGQYDTFQHAYDTAEGWISGSQEGRRLYVLINNLGCAQ